MMPPSCIIWFYTRFLLAEPQVKQESFNSLTCFKIKTEPIYLVLQALYLLSQLTGLQCRRLQPCTCVHNILNTDIIIGLSQNFWYLHHIQFILLRYFIARIQYAVEIYCIRWYLFRIKQNLIRNNSALAKIFCFHSFHRVECGTGYTDKKEH